MIVVPRIKPSVTTKELFKFLIRLFSFQRLEKRQYWIKLFEKEFSRRFGFPRGVAVSKSRIAFFLLLKSLPLKPMGEVIISGIHVADYVNMILLAGFQPVVVDLELGQYTLDFEDLEAKISDKTTLILVTHLSGYPNNMDTLMDISRQHDIPFIEDCSQAVNSTFRGKRLGTFGIAAIYSLGPFKPICTLTGGFVLSMDPNLVQTVRNSAESFQAPSNLLFIPAVIKHLILICATSKFGFRGITRMLLLMLANTQDMFSKFQKYNKTTIRRNSLPTDFLVRFCWQQARLGLTQLSTVDNRESVKAAAGGYLYRRLSEISPSILPRLDNHKDPYFWLFPIVIEDPDVLKRNMLKKGIDSSRLLLSCLSMELAFRDLSIYIPNCESLKERTLFLPLYHSISQNELEAVVESVANYCVSGKS